MEKKEVIETANAIIKQAEEWKANPKIELTAWVALMNKVRSLSPVDGKPREFNIGEQDF